MPETREPAQRVIDALNETGVPFVEDAWFDENANPVREDYGIVEITGSQALYGDGKMVAQNLRGNIILYVMDGSDETAGSVQDRLKTIDGLSFTLAGKEFLGNLMANRWTWRFELEEGL